MLYMGMFSKFSIKKCSSYKKERRKKRTLTHFNGSRLGKVRQTIWLMGVPWYKIATRRSINTFVLPVPAEADTHILVAGLDARC